eukprot:scaffold360_cov374-Pavlova_lutheri.AAC.30
MGREGCVRLDGWEEAHHTETRTVVEEGRSKRACSLHRGRERDGWKRAQARTEGKPVRTDPEHPYVDARGRPSRARVPVASPKIHDRSRVRRGRAMSHNHACIHLLFAKPRGSCLSLSLPPSPFETWWGPPPSC